MKQNPTPCITNLFMLTIAGIVNAFGITLLMTPVKLYDSGISGTSMLLEQITPSLFILVVLLIDFKYSFIFDWTQKTRKEIYLLCYIYCFYIQIKTRCQRQAAFHG